MGTAYESKAMTHAKHQNGQADVDRQDCGLTWEEQFTILGRCHRVAALPDGLVYDRQLGIVHAGVATLQSIGPRYAYGTIFGPRAVKAPNGDLLVFGAHGGLYFVPGVAANHAVMWRSIDGGRTWQDGVAPWEMPTAKEHCIVPFVDPAEPGRIYTLSNASADSTFTAAVVLRHSDDNGQTWTDPERIQPHNDPSFPGGPVHMRGAVLDDGTWLWGIYYRDSNSIEGDVQFVLRSTDRGSTWTVHPGPAPRGWQHPVWKRYLEGIVVSGGVQSAILYLRAPGGCIWEMRSTDSGLTWNEAKETPGLVHPDAPPMIYAVAGGRYMIALIHNRYSPEHPHHWHPDRTELWVSVSLDKGQRWSAPRFLCGQAKVPVCGQSPENTCDWDVSYADLLLNAGTLHIFVGDGQRQVLHFRLPEEAIEALPSAKELGVGTPLG